MVKFNPVIVLCAGFLICICFYFIFFPMISPEFFGQKKPVTVFPSYDAPFGKLLLATNISTIPQNITLYRVTPDNNDLIHYINGDPANNPGNVTSESEAPQVAQKILEKYGGLPEGAGPFEIETEYIENIDLKTGQVVGRTPYTTVVNCQRSLDGKQVIGGYIKIELGNNGELLSLRKVWRTVTPSGTIPVIPATTALEKILRGEILNDRPKCNCDLTVDKVRLAYLEKDYDETQEYLNPVWVFHGTLSSGDSYSYQVSALDSTEKPVPLLALNTPSNTDIGMSNSLKTTEMGNNT
jgi:hypothetical protein